ncbi:MAG: UDP-N-acetylmuramoyl-tripeptide--D-alanyl-D-alanine ligase [Clostridia bacterium]|nr:UDP-N-acetylmuramoyl-tripeptide--D-alanyl-D-alanine ligase [Clostridia bacterium]
MKQLSIREIARATGGTAHFEGAVEDVCIDNRALTAGCLFVCIQGERFDGHAFAADALQKGAAAVLCARDLGLERQIVVPDTRRALLDLARFYRGLFTIPLAAVTGSVGKTTVKEMTAAVFGAKYRTLKTEGNLNNEIGLPRTLFRLDDETQAAVIEMGMNHFGEISRLSRTALPTLAIIGNIGVSHIENLGSQENILKAKLEILDGMAPDAPLILNGDDPLLRGAQVGDRPVYDYGIDRDDCAFRAHDIRMTSDGVSFTVDYDGASQRISLPAMGKHNIYNALAAFAAGCLVGVQPQAAADALAGYVPAGMRQRIRKVGGVTFIEDCYNASPDSVRAAFSTLHDLPASRRIAVLGDMLELGSVSQAAHRESGVLAAKNADILLAYGAQSEETVAAATENGMQYARHFQDKQALSRELSALLRAGDAVLVKGSRGMKLEEILQSVYEEMGA